jgi:hypothetical protein
MANEPPRSRSGKFSRFWIYTAAIVIVWFGFWFLRPRLLCGTRKDPKITQALSNARQIGLALSDFKVKYGRFPDSTTLVAIKQEQGVSQELGDRTSNDLFKQLIVADVVQSEEIFFAKIPNVRLPDNQTSPASKMLEANEVGFAYIIGDPQIIPDERPLVVAPLLPSTTKFDPIPFGGKAIVLRADLSAFTYPISPAGDAIGPEGKSLLSPNQSYWNGVPPIIKWPETEVIRPTEAPRSLSHDYLWIGAGGLVSVGLISFLTAYVVRMKAAPSD